MLLETTTAVLPALAEGLGALRDLGVGLVGTGDQAPEPEDVKAGWTAFGLFLAGLVAVGLLGWSLVRQLRKVEDARKRGVYGDEPETDDAAAVDDDQRG